MCRPQIVKHRYRSDQHHEVLCNSFEIICRAFLGYADTFHFFTIIVIFIINFSCRLVLVPLAQQLIVHAGSLQNLMGVLQAK